MVHKDQNIQVRRTWYFLHAVVWVGSPDYWFLFCRHLSTKFSVALWCGLLSWSLGLDFALGQTATLDEKNWSHSFDNGTWPNEEVWLGNLDHFNIVQATLPSARGPSALQLNADEAGQSVLFRRQKSAFGTWSLIIEQTFVSSSVNRHHIMLFVDDSVSRDGLNGYGITTGGPAANRTFTLFRMDGGELFPLLSHPLEVREGVYRVTVTRDENFQWSLKIDDLSSARTPGFGSGTVVEVIDSIHTQARFFGIRFRYTSTRKNATTLDDMTFMLGKSPPSVEIDSEAPFIEGLFYGVTTPDTLFILVSEDLDQQVMLVRSPQSSASASYLSGQLWSVPLAEMSNWNPFRDPLSVERLQDWTGNRTLDIEAPPPARFPTSGEIVITEAMLRPIDDDYDGRPNQSQYLEIWNSTDEWLWVSSLEYHLGWKENGGASWKETHCISCLTADDFKAHILPPHSFGMVFPEPIDSFLDMSSTRIVNSHPELPLSTPFWRVDGKTMGFRSTENHVVLAVRYGNRLPQIMDSVRLSDVSHHPLLPSTRGIALERLATRPASTQENQPTTSYLDGWNPNHWVSSGHPSGGTPGQRNHTTIHQEDPQDNEWVQLSPDPFTPNQDGVDDILRIQYQLNAPDYLIDASIFTIQGVPLNYLSRGQLAGSHGVLYWKGWTSDGVLVPAGLYLLHVRAYGSTRAKPVSITIPVGVIR